MANPIFIGGMYKSGTSLLRAMLGRHSRLSAGLETQWLHEQWNTNATAARRKWLERLAVFFEASLGELEAICGNAYDVETCLDRTMNFLTASIGKARWIEKTPENAGAIQRILGYWPQARILHIIRDPRDVFASIVETRSWTIQEFARRWNETVVGARSWLADQGGASPFYYELRYERLVSSPATEVGKLLEFLGEQFEAEVAEFAGQPQDFDRVRRATGKESPTLRRLAEPLTTARIGVWCKVVTPTQWAAAKAELRRVGGELVEQLIDETEAICGTSQDLPRQEGH